MDLRLGDYREVLRDVTCQAVIVDAPYFAKTYARHTHAKALKRLTITPVTTDWLNTVPKGEQGGLW